MDFSVEALTSRVELTVECSKLRDRDYLSKSDPMCILSIRELTSDQWHEFDRTEMIKDNLNPKFSHKFIMDYHFEQCQRLRFEVYDVDHKKKDLKSQDYLGFYEANLGQLVSRKINEGKMLKCGKASSIMRISCLELGSSKESLFLQLEGKGLDKKDTFGKSDPYLQIYRAEDSVTSESQADEKTQWTLVYRTEVVKKTLDPVWGPFQVLMMQLCAGDKDRLLRFDCYDWDKIGKHDYIGTFYTSFMRLMSAYNDPQKNCMQLINTKKQKRRRITKTAESSWSDSFN